MNWQDCTPSTSILKILNSFWLFEFKFVLTGFVWKFYFLGFWAEKFFGFGETGFCRFNFQIIWSLGHNSTGRLGNFGGANLWHSIVGRGWIVGIMGGEKGWALKWVISKCGLGESDLKFLDDDNN